MAQSAINGARKDLNGVGDVEFRELMLIGRYLVGKFLNLDRIIILAEFVKPLKLIFE